MPSKKLALENIVGTLADCVRQTEPGTWQTSAEITTERRADPSLAKQWFWTANFAMYRTERGEAVLYFGGREANPIFENIEEAASQLISSGNYYVDEESVAGVIDSVSSGATLRIGVSNLNLKKHDKEFSYFEINPSRPGQLNLFQRRFAEMVYGQGSDFSENMRMLSDSGIKSTRIYVLNPDYVKDNAAGSQAIARACWLNDCDIDSDFIASGSYVAYPSIALRGVRKGVAEGDELKINPKYREAYQAMLQGQSILHTPKGDYVLAKTRIRE
jgi:hypothetical protein